jgi:hypothetical protein
VLAKSERQTVKISDSIFKKIASFVCRAFASVFRLSFKINQLYLFRQFYAGISQCKEIRHCVLLRQNSGARAAMAFLPLGVCPEICHLPYQPNTQMCFCNFLLLCYFECLFA